MGVEAPSGTLSLRALNRATLARQALLERARLEPQELIECLGGLQAQAPNPPYVALWARLASFQREELTRLLEQKRVVRSALMRGTLHLATAQDYLAFRPLIQPVLTRGHKGAWGKFLQGLDPMEVATAGCTLLAEMPLTSNDLGKRLQKQWPEYDPKALAQAVRNFGSLIHVPPAGTWGAHPNPRLTPAAIWLGKTRTPEGSLEALALRYLSAFGPASAKDLGTWCGLTGLSPVLEALRPQLQSFRDESGRELFDLPDASRPDPETPAPPRLLSEFDNLLLSYADGSRILAPEHRRAVMTVNGLVSATILVDGFVCGTWNLERGKGRALVRVSPFAALRKTDRAALEAEGQRFLAFAGVEGEVAFTAPGS